MIKRINAIILIISILIFAIPDIYASSISGEYYGITWVLDEDGTLTISGSGEIPDMLGTPPLQPIEIGHESEYTPQVRYSKYSTLVKNVIINDGITALGLYSFSHFDNLISVYIPSSVKKIGPRAFYHCDNLTTVTMSNGVEIIEENSFSWTSVRKVNYMGTHEDWTKINISKTGNGSLLNAYQNTFKIDNVSIEEKDDFYNFNIQFLNDANKNDGSILVALYNDKKLVYTINTKMQIGEVDNITINTPKLEATHAKIFWWNDLSCMYPLNNAITVPIN